MQLSSHFTLESMVASPIAARRGIDNTPSSLVIAQLTATCAQMEKVRALLGNKPIYVSSGYRCAELNLAVGGAPTSAHVSGNAVDFTCPDFGTPFEVATFLASTDLRFDQLIYEYVDWVHLSFDARLRNQRLTIINGSQGYLADIVQG